ncbi:MAG: formyltransferase family protein [Planctomycetota bacterium]
MKIVFFGYHDFGVEALDSLIETGDEIAAVITHRDDPDENRYFRSVADLAKRNGVPVEYREDQEKGRLRRLLEETEADLIVSAYYRRMIPEALLGLARHGGVNLHGSLLPKYRGRCPLNWALIHDERETGLTLHRMVARADAGEILGARAVAIEDRETAHTLAQKLVAEVKPLMAEVFPRLRRGDFAGVPQVESEATTFGGRRPEDGRIDWSKTARQVDCLVRAVTRPYPGAFTEIDGRRLRVWSGHACSTTGDARLPGRILECERGRIKVQCGEGAYCIEDCEWWEAGGISTSVDWSALLPGRLLVAPARAAE